jgi:hypothetical protein
MIGECRLPIDGLRIGDWRLTDLAVADCAESAIHNPSIANLQSAIVDRQSALCNRQ